MNIICFASEKGGCGKSTCAVNLGAALAKMKKKMLLIDMDSQGSLTYHLSLECKNISGNIVDVLDGRVSINNAITECKSGLHFIASSRKLAEYTDKDFRDNFSDVLKEVNGNYDYIFLDFPPMLSDFTIVLLAVSNQVIIPVEGRGGLSLRGLRSQLETVKLVQDNLNPRLEVNGIIICRLATRMKLCKEVKEYLQKGYRDWLYNTTIRESIKIAEAASVGKSILTHSKSSISAKEFESLAKEFLQRKKTRSKRKKE